MFLSREYPDATILTNDMVNGWCNKRSSESAQSRHTRIKAVIAFIKYLNDKTIIVISHRFNNKKLFDRVLKIENGVVIDK